MFFGGDLAGGLGSRSVMYGGGDGGGRGVGAERVSQRAFVRSFTADSADRRGIEQQGGRGRPGRLVAFSL